MTLEFGETGRVQPVWARYCRIKVTLHDFPSKAHSCLLEFEGS